MARDQTLSAYMSVTQVAVFWDVHEQTVRNWLARGELPAVRLAGRALRIPRAAVEQLGEPFQVGSRTA